MSERFCDTVTVCNKLGLHIRPSRQVAELVQKYDAKVTVINGARSAGADSQLDLLMLVASAGTELEICAEGPDAEEAVGAIVEIVENRFGEEN